MLSSVTHPGLAYAYPAPSHTVPPFNINTPPVQRSNKGMVGTVWSILHKKTNVASLTPNVVTAARQKWFVFTLDNSQVKKGVKALLSGYCSHKEKKRMREGDAIILPTSLSF